MVSSSPPRGCSSTSKLAPARRRSGDPLARSGRGRECGWPSTRSSGARCVKARGLTTALWAASAAKTRVTQQFAATVPCQWGQHPQDRSGTGGPQQQSGSCPFAGRVSADLQPLGCGPGRDRGKAPPYVVLVECGVGRFSSPSSLPNSVCVSIPEIERFRRSVPVAQAIVRTTNAEPYEIRNDHAPSLRWPW